MRRSDSDAIQRACEAFQRSVLSLNLKRPEERARAWPGTKHMESAIDEYLEATVRESRVSKAALDGSSTADAFAARIRALSKAIHEALGAYDWRVQQGLVALGKVDSMETLRATVNREGVPEDA